MSISLSDVFKPSEDVVAREIEGEIIIVPIAAGIGDMEDELYSLNETGRAIWDRLDGHTTLADVAGELTARFDADPDIVSADVLGLVGELADRGIVVAC
jgi:hypothetical protein